MFVKIAVYHTNQWKVIHDDDDQCFQIKLTYCVLKNTTRFAMKLSHESFLFHKSCVT